jgi:hypothetical protein
MLVQNNGFLPRVFGALLVLALAASAASAHQPASAQTAAISSTLITATGTVAELTVKNQLTGVTLRYLGLTLDLGGSFALTGAGLDKVSNGSRINATGTLTGNVFNVVLFGTVAPAAGSARVAQSQARKTLSGTLAVYHKDFFEEGRGEYGLAIRDASGQVTLLNVAAIPDSLEIGMQITVDGTLAADGHSVDVSTISILASAPAELNDVAEAPVTNTVLVIPIRFSDTPAGDPWNSAAINTEFQSKVAPYYQEVSYGQQLLNISVACATAPVPAGCAGKTDVAGWLKSSLPTPTSCDFTMMGTLADGAATAAGYDISVTPHKFVYYVLPSIGACGWAGLAYVGWGHAWSNGVNALWVYGHELGHNFGLWHAGSVSCGAKVLGDPLNVNDICSVSEYGDPFDVMGNIRQMHFNAMQKNSLSAKWIPDTAVKIHTSGTQTYQLSPLETGGQTTYAVKIPTPDTKRTYWVEFRQPIGFDSPLSSLPNLGAQIRVSGLGQQFDYTSGGNDTQILDMTPGSGGGFNDAALLVGQTYTDSKYGISINVISATPSLLTLSVSMSGASSPPTLASAVSRKVHGAAGTFNLPLVLTPVTNPTTEPRQGPTQTIVFTFNKAITAASVAVTECTATAAAPTFSGNDVNVVLTGVTNAQYVTVALSNVTSADGGTGGAGSVRVGFLAGDVNQNRTVTVADLGLVNAQLAQPVTASNYLNDINASGTLTATDKTLVNGKLSTSLPAP